MTFIIASIVSTDAVGMAESANRAFDSGADVVELRLDALEAGEVSGLVGGAVNHMDKCLATCRPLDEGGVQALALEERLERLELLRSAGCGWVDVEIATWRRLKGGQRARVAPNDASRLIVSHHDFASPLVDAVRLYDELAAEVPEAVIKLAWQAETLADNWAALDLMERYGERVIAIAMGEKGILSRTLAGKYGAFGTFVAPTAEAATAPGQVTLADALERYRMGEQSRETAVFGVVGSPVGHSMSPVLFNALYARDGVEAVYLPLRVDTAAEFEAFVVESARNEAFRAGGFSVTLPHKRTCLHVGGAKPDGVARRIGAANTLVVGARGLASHNTDAPGAIAALLTAMGWKDLSGRRVGILGAGGAARAIAAGVVDAGGHVAISNRTFERAERLADEFGGEAIAWEARGAWDVDVLVNCTSVGMQPAVDASPYPREGLRPGLVVFDTVYNPLETRLLREAKAAVSVVISGLEMFVRQAALQYALWTGRDADLDVLRDLVRERLAVGAAATRRAVDGGSQS